MADTTLSTAPPAPRGRGVRLLQWVREQLLVPLLAILTAFLVGGVLIMVTGNQPGAATLRIGPWTVGNPFLAYLGLLEGAFGSWEAISETLVWSTPYIFAGLAVALGFQGGLFNIGAEGQITAGALVSVYIGYALHGLPWPLHMLLAVAGGVLAGAVWGGIPGWLKARTGGHEVINTIMMNYLILFASNYLLAGPMKDPNPNIAVAQTPKILPSARIPRLIPGTDLRLHWGVVLAFVTAFLVYWFLWKTPLGFEIRATGANREAARYAGIRVNRILVLTMALSGALAGLAGAVEVTGLHYYHTLGFSVGYGFDSIAIALLGRSHPFGIIPAAILFGALRNGASRMQFLTQVPIDIISVFQALVLAFVAAPVIVRKLYRLKAAREERMTLTQGWGG